MNNKETQTDTGEKNNGKWKVKRKKCIAEHTWKEQEEEQLEATRRISHYIYISYTTHFTVSLMLSTIRKTNPRKAYVRLRPQ